jgi:hypothetical protein
VESQPTSGAGLALNYNVDLIEALLIRHVDVVARDKPGMVVALHAYLGSSSAPEFSCPV